MIYLNQYIFEMSIGEVSLCYPKKTISKSVATDLYHIQGCQYPIHNKWLGFAHISTTSTNDKHNFVEVSKGV